MTTIAIKGLKYGKDFFVSQFICTVYIQARVSLDGSLSDR